MFIIDILMVLQIKVLMKIRKNEDLSDVKWSAFLFTSFIISQFILSLVITYSIISKNQVSDLIINNLQILWIISMLISPFLIYFRYYKCLDNETLIDNYENLSKQKKQLMKVLILILIVVIPLICFLLHRIVL